MFTAAELLQLVEAIYTGILDSAAWEAAIAELCRALGGETAALALHDARSHGVANVVFVDIDRTYRATYSELIGLPDMEGTFRAVGEGAALGAITGEDLNWAAPDFERSRFHEEWLQAQDLLDMIAAPLVPAPAVVGGLFIGRPRIGSGFGASQLDALRILRPHLARAVQARLRLDGAASVASAALAALDVLNEGVLLVDSASAIVHANRAAEAALRRGDGVGVTRSILACDHPDDTAILRQLIGEASARTSLRSGGPLAVRRRSGRRSLSVLVAPLRTTQPVPMDQATAMVLVADPESAVPGAGEALRAIYGLTAAEAQTAGALLDHVPLADVAGKLGVSLATVRTLLQRAFDKTDTHSQAELVRLMLAHQLPTGVGADEAMASRA